MEPLIHSRHARRRSNSTKVNVIIAVVVHVILFAGAAYWAAKQGILGERMRELSVSLVRGEKKEDKQKKEDKPEPVKKVDVAKIVEQARTATPAGQKFVAPPPPANLPDASVAPPPVAAPSDFVFGEEVLGGANPVDAYKGLIEGAFRSRWQRPTDVADLGFEALIEISLDKTGKVIASDMKKSSGNSRWDESVKRALSTVSTIGKPPPQGFPSAVIVRFDVVEEKEVPVGMQ